MTVDLAKTPSFRLDGKRALVTGGGRGIGLAAASALAAAGAHVTLAARTKAEIDEAAAAIRARGEKADALVLDVTDVEAAKTALAKLEPYQILINNAGSNRPAYLPDVKVEDFDFIFALNVRAAFFMAQTVALRLIEAKLPGSIINISSQMGHVGAARRTVYCASQARDGGFHQGDGDRTRAAQHPRQFTRADLPGNADDRPFFENKAFRDEVLSQDQARPARATGRTHRRDRVPRFGRVVIDDRLGAGARRRLDSGVIPGLILRRREAPSRRMAVSSGECRHPSRRALRALLRMRP